MLEQLDCLVAAARNGRPASTITTRRGGTSTRTSRGTAVANSVLPLPSPFSLRWSGSSISSRRSSSSGRGSGSASRAPSSTSSSSGGTRGSGRRSGGGRGRRGRGGRGRRGRRASRLHDRARHGGVVVEHVQQPTHENVLSRGAVELPVLVPRLHQDARSDFKSVTSNKRACVGSGRDDGMMPAHKAFEVA